MNAELRTIPEALDERAAECGEQTAYIFDGVRYTWRDCERQAEAFAAELFQKGVRAGTHVGIWGVNSYPWVCCYFAVLKLGAVAVLLNFSYKEKEMAEILNYAQVEYLAMGEARGSLNFGQIISNIRGEISTLKEAFFLSELGKTAQELTVGTAYYPEPEDTAVIIFTSGTTKRPKGVMLAHGQLLQAMQAVVDRLGGTEEDCQLLTLPLFHGSGGNSGILVGLLAGMTSVIQRRYQSVPVMKAIEEYQCTVFNAVPSMLLMMIHNPEFGTYDLSSLQSGILSGSSIAPEQYDRILEKTGYRNLQQAYGMTETSTLNTLVRRDADMLQKRGTAGEALPGVQIRIWNCREQREADAGAPGEIQIRGSYLMKGYYNMEEQTRQQFLEDGWFRTGDSGWLDEMGSLHFQSRLSEMIVRGGENISPSEIENQIMLCDSSISAVKVVGVPAPIIQEEVVALVKTDNGSIREEAVREYVCQHLADYKVPKYVFVIPEFPMTGSGKIDLKASRELAGNLVKERENNE